MINGERVLIVSTMKNEGPYILEWVAHHLALGIDEMLIFTNDCDDGTDRILGRLGRLVGVHQVPNPKTLFRDRGNWQVMALRFARQFSLYLEADWIYHTDADEFLQILPGEGTLDDFHAAASARAGRFDAVSFTSIPFASGGELELRDQPVTGRFTRLNKPYAAKRAAGEGVNNAIKTLYRNDVAFDIRRNHRPLMKDFTEKGHVWIDGSANVLPPEFANGKDKFTDAIRSTDLAQMNHYAIKCAEAFLVKLDRGDVAGVSRLDTDRKYWENYNSEGDPETRFTRMRPAAQALYESFLADPVLGPLHRDALDVHQAKAKRLRNRPDWAAMVQRLGLL